MIKYIAFLLLPLIVNDDASTSQQSGVTLDGIESRLDQIKSADWYDDSTRQAVEVFSTTARSLFAKVPSFYHSALLRSVDDSLANSLADLSDYHLSSYRRAVVASRLMSLSASMAGLTNLTWPDQSAFQARETALRQLKAELLQEANEIANIPTDARKQISREIDNLVSSYGSNALDPGFYYNLTPLDTAALRELVDNWSIAVQAYFKEVGNPEEMSSAGQRKFLTSVIAELLNDMRTYLNAPERMPKGYGIPPVWEKKNKRLIQVVNDEFLRAGREEFAALNAARDEEIAREREAE